MVALDKKLINPKGRVSYQFAVQAYAGDELINVNTYDFITPFVLWWTTRYTPIIYEGSQAPVYSAHETFSRSLEVKLSNEEMLAVTDIKVTFSIK